jgi:hypothetical protein
VAKNKPTDLSPFQHVLRSSASSKWRATGKGAILLSSEMKPFRYLNSWRTPTPLHRIAFNPSKEFRNMLLFFATVVPHVRENDSLTLLVTA